MQSPCIHPTVMDTWWKRNVELCRITTALSLYLRLLSREFQLLVVHVCGWTEGNSSWSLKVSIAAQNVLQTKRVVIQPESSGWRQLGGIEERQGALKCKRSEMCLFLIIGIHLKDMLASRKWNSAQQRAFSRKHQKSFKIHMLIELFH